MNRCDCANCRERRGEGDRVTVGDVLGLLAVVALFVIIFGFLPLGSW